MLATANRAKAREMAALLEGVPFRILTLADFPGVSPNIKQGSFRCAHEIINLRALVAQ